MKNSVLKVFGPHPRRWWPVFPKYLKQPAVYHTLFWIFYFLFNVGRWGSYHNDYIYAIKANLIEFPLHMAFAYCNIYYLIPKFLPRKYLKYVFFVIVGVILVVIGRLVLENVFQVFPAQPPYINFQYLAELAVGEIYVQGFITAFKLLLDWGKSQKHTRELEKRNFETELAFLRSQVQPHFFFNTLNNLYSLTLDKSDRAPETVLKLSDLMSYVIYEGKQKKVHVSKELRYIQNYLDLERLRFGDKLHTEFTITGEIKDHEIAPLILLPFIENSFKHGALDSMKKIVIKIALKMNDHHILFTIRNTKSEKINAHASNNTYQHPGHNGVGVENIKRRLKLIYGDTYHLTMKDETENFTVTLRIPTHENTLSNS